MVDVAVCVGVGEVARESRARQETAAVVAAAVVVVVVAVCVDVCLGEERSRALEPSFATDGDSGCRRESRNRQETAAVAAVVAVALSV